MSMAGSPAAPFLPATQRLSFGLAGWLGLTCMLHAESANSSLDQPGHTLPPVVIIGTNTFEDWPVQRSSATETVLSAAQLERAGILSTIELPRAVPNLSQSHGGLRSCSDTYVVRGLGNTEFISDPGVVLYVDGVPFGDVTT